MRTRVKRQDIAYRWIDLSKIFGVSTRALQASLKKGHFPEPDFYRGRTPYWRRITILQLQKKRISEM